MVPARLLPLYPMPVPFIPLSPPFFLSAAAVLSLSGVFLYFRRLWPAGLAVWSFYLITLSPVLGLVQFGVQLAADRYTYLSCLGWALLAGAGLRAACEKYPPGAAARRGLLLLAGLSAAGLGRLAWRQTRVWRDSETLWRHTLSFDPDDSVAHNDLGTELLRQGRPLEATEQYRQAVRLNPNLPLFHYNLGNALLAQGKPEEAIEPYEDALRRDPGYEDAHVNLGNILLGKGLLDAAAEHYEAALRTDPGAADLRANLRTLAALRATAPRRNSP